jgi:hypothetical protein
LLDPKSNGKKISKTSESSRMRRIMKQFDSYKRNFEGNTPAMKIDLPEPIDKISISGKINQGELTIKK